MISQDDVNKQFTGVNSIDNVAPSVEVSVDKNQTNASKGRFDVCLPPLNKSFNS